MSRPAATELWQIDRSLVHLACGVFDSQRGDR